MLKICLKSKAEVIR